MEVLCRDMYGIIKSFEATDPVPGDDQHKKKKVRYQARNAYDVAALWTGAPRCKAADEAVAKNIRVTSATQRALGPGGE